MPEMIPDRASNAGPEPTPALDWRDYLDFAGENVRAAGRIEIDDRFRKPADRNRNRISAINYAIEQLERAKEELCK